MSEILNENTSIIDEKIGSLGEFTENSYMCAETIKLLNGEETSYLCSGIDNFIGDLALTNPEFANFLTLQSV